MTDETSRRDDERLAELLSAPDDRPAGHERQRDVSHGARGEDPIGPPRTGASLEATKVAYAAFMKADAPEGADVAGAERRLQQALDREIFGRSSASSTRERPDAGSSLFDRLTAWLTAPALRPAIGLAAVAVVAGIYLGTRGESGRSPIDAFDVVATDEITLRGSHGGGGSLRTIDVAAGRVALEWPPSAAGGYTIVLSTPEYRELSRLGPFEETRIELELADLPDAARAHAAVFWQVVDGDSEAPRDEIGAIRLR